MEGTIQGSCSCPKIISMEEALFFYLEAAMARTLPAHVPYNKEFCPFTLVGTVQYLVNSGKNSRYRHQPMPEGCLASL